MEDEIYDYIIVGAGIAGLHCAIRLSKEFPKARIALAESYASPGGRIVTYTAPNSAVRWEAGAGRIHSSHHRVLNYVKKYGLTLIPIDPDSIWKSLGGAPEPNTWDSFAKILVQTLGQLDPKLLAAHTIEELLLQIIGKAETDNLLQHFPYRSEVTILRADLALKAFAAELGESGNFFIIKESLGELIRRMRDELTQAGVKLLLHHRLLRVTRATSEGIITLHFDVRALKTKHAVLAVPRDSLKAIQPFPNLPALRHIRASPLLRTYAIFPKPTWHSAMKKTVTNSPLRYIIPVGDALMISYTDGNDTGHWNTILDKEGAPALGKAIVKEARRLFPEASIPNPLFFKAHYWPDGAYYWTPGHYNPIAASEGFRQPLPQTFPTLFVCGESYSLRQAWMEGALEHADSMLEGFLLS